jgi:hypothetical protein
MHTASVIAWLGVSGNFHCWLQAVQDGLAVSSMVSECCISCPCDLKVFLRQLLQQRFYSKVQITGSETSSAVLEELIY